MNINTSLHSINLIFGHPIRQPLLMPDLKILIERYRSGIFKSFGTKNYKLEQLEIDYGSFEDETEFIKQLIGMESLKSVRIKIFRRIIVWEKKDRIYYNIGHL